MRILLAYGLRRDLTPAEIRSRISIESARRSKVVSVRAHFPRSTAARRALLRWITRAHSCSANLKEPETLREV
jgi:hypothetical protein